MQINVNAVMSIKGMPMVDLGRAAGLLWLSFGEIVRFKPRDVDVEKPQYALHFQCPWRFTLGGNIVLGSYDICLPRPGIPDDEFDSWEAPIGDTLFDVQADALRADIPLEVNDLHITPDGRVTIDFDKGFQFEALTNSSHANTEFWRFINFSPHKHIVVFGE